MRLVLVSRPSFLLDNDNELVNITRNAPPAYYTCLLLQLTSTMTRLVTNKSNNIQHFRVFWAKVVGGNSSMNNLMNIQNLPKIPSGEMRF